jgi:hypothetical protein
MNNILTALSRSANAAIKAFHNLSKCQNFINIFGGKEVGQTAGQGNMQQSPKHLYAMAKRAVFKQQRGLSLPLTELFC